MDGQEAPGEPQPSPWMTSDLKPSSMYGAGGSAETGGLRQAMRGGAPLHLACPRALECAFLTGTRDSLNILRAGSRLLRRTQISQPLSTRV